MGRNTLIIVIVIPLILLAGAIYVIFQNQKTTGQQSNLILSPTPTPTLFSASLSPTITPSSAPVLTLSLTQNAIKTNINAQNYQGLIPYMTSNVNVILQATECCGPKTPQETISQMSYVDEGIPLNFDQESELAKNLKSKNPELTDKFIGVSTSKEHLLAFTINSQNKISEIRLAVSWKLFSY